MINLVWKPHRASLQAGSADVQKVFALLKVIPDARVARSRPPLAFVLLMDSSGSMREAAVSTNTSGATATGGTKLERMMEAAHAFVDDGRLRPDDRVAVVGFDDAARLLLPLEPLGDRRAAHHAIQSLRGYSGGTMLAQGLRQAALVVRDVPPRFSRRIVLLTDGEASDEAECRPLAALLGEANVPLVAVGVGDAYREELLRDLAQNSGGRPYHLREAAHFGGVLDSEVSTSLREVVTDLQAEVVCAQGVRLDSVTRVYPSLAEMSIGSLPLRLGNITAGDYTVFTCEFTVSGMVRPVSRARLARLQLSGCAPGQEENPSAAPATAELLMAFTGDTEAVTDVDAEVLGYVQQRNADRLVQDAVQQASRDIPAARRTLHQALDLTRRIGNPAVTQMLQDALDELDGSGALAPGTRKTIALGGRTRTVKTVGANALEGVPSEAAIRKMTGT